MQQQETAILIASITLIILVILIIFLFIIFQKRKNRLLRSQEKEREQFEQEIANTQIEIREQTLRNISWELHDNIGQLLTLAKIQLQNGTPESLIDANKTIASSLHEIRSLSKLINPDIIKNINLCQAVQQELGRFERLKFIKTKFTLVGNVKALNSKHEIILFRILQEFFSNTIKHSKATILSVNINYQEKKLSITAIDNGVGFDTTKQDFEGIGLQNIKNRAKLINTKIEIFSEINKGTSLSIVYNY